MENLKQTQQLNGEILSIKIEIVAATDLHFNDALRFFFVLSGHIELSKRGQHVFLRAGDIYLLNEGELVSFLGSDENIVLTVSISLVSYHDDIPFFRLDRPLSTAYKSEAYDAFTGCLAMLFAENTYQKKGYLQMTEGYIKQLLGLLLRYVTIDASGMVSTINADLTEKMAEVIKYINEHYAEKLSLDQIADQFFINKYYLSHTFKEQLGISIGSYLKELRLFHSTRLLNNTNKKIVDIALDNGFPSLRAFNTALKEKYGFSPLVYRKQHRSEEVMATSKLDSQQDILQLLAPYLQGKGAPERENFVQKITIDTTKSVTTFQPIHYILKVYPEHVKGKLSLVRKSLGIKYVSVTNLFSMIDLSFEKQKMVVLFHGLDELLERIIEQNMIPYIQIQMIDYDQWLEKFNQPQAVLNEVISRLKFHLVNRYPNFTKWLIEFRCFYELGDDSKLCEPLAELIDIFAGYENLMIHFPKTPIEAASLDTDLTDFVYCINDEMVTKKLPWSVVQSNLHNKRFIEAIRNSKNVQSQMVLLEKALKLEQDDYLRTYFHLSLANLTIWQFINQRIDGEQYFTPISLDTEKVFTYFPEELANKVSLCTKAGLIKESWYAYEFLGRLYGEVVFRNDFCIVTKSKENYRILGTYPEEELMSFLNQRENFEAVTSLKKAQSSLISLELKLLNLHGRYKIIKQELTPEVIDSRKKLFQMDDYSMLSSDDISFYNAVSRPSRKVIEVDIKEEFDIKITLPIFGIMMIELEKVE